MVTDNCQFCLGAKGGVAGNENRIANVSICDYCHTLLNQIFKQLNRSRDNRVYEDVRHQTEVDNIFPTPG